MKAAKFSESTVEIAALEWLSEVGYAITAGPDLLPDGLFAERSGPGDVLLRRRLRDALVRINSDLPAAAIDEAIRTLAGIDAVLPIDRNHQFHTYVVKGIGVEYAGDDGSIAATHVKLVDDDWIENNDWLAVNQFTVVEGHHHRRPDIVVFVNGLPLALVELKNAADEETDIEGRISRSRPTRTRSPRFSTPTKSASSPTARWRASER